MPDKQNELSDRRKLLSILSHCSIWFSPTIVTLGIPIALILLSKDEVVVGNAKEAFNFCITGYILSICFIFLIFFAIGIPLLVLLFVAMGIKGCALALSFLALSFLASIKYGPLPYPIQHAKPCKRR